MKSIILHDWTVSESGLNLPHVKLLKREEVMVLSKLRGSRGETCKRLIQTPCRSRSTDVDMVHILRARTGEPVGLGRRVHAGGNASEERHGVGVSFCKVGLERMEELTNICFVLL